jgi:hypothetical protein
MSMTVVALKKKEAVNELVKIRYLWMPFRLTASMSRYIFQKAGLIGHLFYGHFYVSQPPGRIPVPGLGGLLTGT